MEPVDFSRFRIDAMINLNDPLAVLATRLPWGWIEAALASKCERQRRAGQSLEGRDMFGPTLFVAGAGISRAGRPKPGRLPCAGRADSIRHNTALPAHLCTSV